MNLSPQPKPHNPTPTMNTHPTTMTKEEAIVRLCAAAQKTADTDFLRAVVIAAKCLARDGIHKRRVHKSRSARGLTPFIAQTPAPLSPDAPPCGSAPVWTKRAKKEGGDHAYA